MGALVGLVLGLYWTSFVVWPAVIGVLQIRKRFDVKTTDWVDFLGFLGTFLLLSMTWKFHFFPRISVPKSPESELEAWAQSL